MKGYFYTFLKYVPVTFCLLFAGRGIAFSQCKETISVATKRKVHYHKIPLKGDKEYLTVSRSGDERLFSYHNEDIELVFHAKMFTEIRFTSDIDRFSLYSCTSDRTRWQTCFTLTAPVTDKEIKKMQGTSRVEIILPEETKVFVFSNGAKQQLQKALTCLQ